MTTAYTRMSIAPRLRTVMKKRVVIMRNPGKLKLLAALLLALALTIPAAAGANAEASLALPTLTETVSEWDEAGNLIADEGKYFIIDKESHSILVSTIPDIAGQTTIDGSAYLSSSDV